MFMSKVTQLKTFLVHAKQFLWRDQEFAGSSPFTTVRFLPIRFSHSGHDVERLTPTIMALTVLVCKIIKRILFIYTLAIQ